MEVSEESAGGGGGSANDPGDRLPYGRNAKLKRLLADRMLDNVVLKDLLGKN